MAKNKDNIFSPVKKVISKLQEEIEKINGSTYSFEYDEEGYEEDHNLKADREYKGGSGKDMYADSKMREGPSKMYEKKEEAEEARANPLEEEIIKQLEASIEDILRNA